MNIQDPNPENPLASKPATAEGEQPCQGNGDASIRDAMRADGQLVDRCLAGDERAWEQLYRKCHPRLRKAVELLLGPEADDVHLIEEIAARVWYELLRHHCRLLAMYDPARDSTLESFLMGLARIEILRYTRSERRRQSHELIGGRRRLEEQRVCDWQVTSMMDEFASTLTPGEREFLETFLTGPAEAENDPELDNLSSSNIWQRRRRIRVKLNDFLKNL